MSQNTCDIARTPQLITTKNLELIPLSALNCQEVVTYYLDNKDFHREFSPTTPDNFFTEEFWQRKIWQSLKDWQEDSAYRFMIRVKGESEHFPPLCGNINITQVFRGPFQNGILGYSMHKDFQGKGFMSQAVAAVVEFAFHKLSLHRIQAATLLDNRASQKVLEKTGFRREGTAEHYLQINGQWRDHALYARTFGQK